MTIQDINEFETFLKTQRDEILTHFTSGGFAPNIIGKVFNILLAELNVKRCEEETAFLNSRKQEELV